MGKSENKSSIVFSIASSFGLLLSKIAYILEINEGASNKVKAEKVEAFLHELGYDIKDGEVGKISEIISGVVAAAEGVEGVINGLKDFPWGAGASDILDFKISDETKKAGADIFEIAKGLVKGVIALKDSIEAFDNNPENKKVLKFLNDNNWGRRFGDHFVISIFHCIDNGRIFDVAFNVGLDAGNITKEEKEALKKTAFVKSVKIILASFELFEVFDTQEVDVLYQDSDEETKDLKALNKKRKEEGKEELEKVKSEINVVHWGRFVDVFSFQWGYLADIYPMEVSTAKLLFKRFSKLVDAIGKDELLDLLNVDGILKWLKSLIVSDDENSKTNKDKAVEKIEDFNTNYKALKPKVVEDTNSLSINKFTFTTISKTFSIEDDDFQKYIIAPTKKVLKREGVIEDIGALQGTIKKAGRDIIALSNKRLESVKEKDLGDWFKFVKNAYEEEKIKINTSDFDFLETMESVKDVILDDIIKIDEFKKILLNHLQTLLSKKLRNTYDEVRIKRIGLEVALEISSTFIRQIILPKLQTALSELGVFVNKSLMLLLDLSQWYDNLSEDYRALRTLIETFNDPEKGWQDRINASVVFAEAVINTLPQELKEKLHGQLQVLQNIYSHFDTSSLNQGFIAIGIYNQKDEEKSINIKLCAQLIEKEEQKAAINIYPMIEGNFKEKFPLGEFHELMVEVQGAINKEKNDTDPLGFQISKNGVSLTGDDEDVSAGVLLKFSRTEAWQIFNHEYIKIAVDNYPQTLSFSYDKGFEAKYTAALEGASITLTKKFFEDKVWELIASAINDDIVASFDTTLSYSTVSGFSFAGSPKLEADFDFSKSFKGLKIDGLHFALGGGTNEASLRNLSFTTSASTNLSLTISGVAFTVNDIGIELDTPLLKEGKLSDWDLAAKLHYPNGIGVAVDTEVVKGGGFIQYDEDESKFLGVLELNIAEKVDLGVLAILNLDVADVPGNFSFVGLMMLSGFSIPLGYNFYLTGAGGALGLNRMIDSKVVENGVHDGTLETVFLAKDLQKNIGKIEKVTNQYFPIKKHQFFFGLIAKIDFNIPAIVTGEVGLFLQLPSPVEIIIFGGLHVVIPEEKPSVKINVYFAGGINFEERFWFDASIRDSSIGEIDIFGDIAMRVLWGKRKECLSLPEVSTQVLKSLPSTECLLICNV